ncbi:hypothetical protein HMN09_00788800 [Mycena chlorophos]|uniref:NAD(P)-binding protein n=1 Tax=Mycena chlorophos TaxID=658473 RepID=A0A8H6SVD7_MYCCL|nr:hypothetical protein HMN09_00788800 [Mycena chlorophos]
MPSLAAVTASNASWKPAYIPVCVFVGGTSGIGEGIVQAVGRHTAGKAHIFLVGRNASAAQRILDALPASEGAVREFVECDLSLVASAKKVAADILARQGRVNLLVLTAGAISLESTITSEGLEKSMAVWYYSRWAFVDGLLPGLKAAQARGEDARVLSMLNAGKGKAFDVSDLGLKNPLAAVKGLGDLRETGAAVATYQDLLVQVRVLPPSSTGTYMPQGYAARHPTLTFIHSAPGPVNTPLYSVSTSAEVRAAGDAIHKATAAEAKTIQECGEHQLYAILNAPAGVSRTGPNGDDIGLESIEAKEGDVETLWVHTEGVIHGL